MKKKKNGLKQEIRLIEFCSKLGKKSLFKYNPKNSKVFSALSWDCLNKNNNYVDNVKPCNHAAMVSDSFLILMKIFFYFVIVIWGKFSLKIKIKFLISFYNNSIYIWELIFFVCFYLIVNWFIILIN